MSDLSRTLAFASSLYRQRAAVAYAGYTSIALRAACQSRNRSR